MKENYIAIFDPSGVEENDPNFFRHTLPKKIAEKQFEREHKSLGMKLLKDRIEKVKNAINNESI